MVSHRHERGEVERLMVETINAADGDPTAAVILFARIFDRHNEECLHVTALAPAGMRADKPFLPTSHDEQAVLDYEPQRSLKEYQR